MLKNISNIGRVLTTAQKRTINGGRYNCNVASDCPRIPGGCNPMCLGFGVCLWSTDCDY